MSRRPRLRHRVEYAAVLVLRWTSRLLGGRLSGWLGGALGRVVYRTVRIRRALVERQLRQAFPDASDRWIRRTAAASYAHLAREGLSMLRLAGRDAAGIRRATRVEGLEALRTAMGQGRGAILVTGHVGNWEIGGAALAARGVPLDVVARRQANPLFDGLVNRARERLGMRVVDFQSGTRGSLRALRDGRAVALVADQDARQAGVFVPFLNRPASTFRGAAVLALRVGAPVFIGTALREGDEHVLRLRPVPEPPPGSDEERVWALTASYTAMLEAVVRGAPEQYLWQHRRWKTSPPPGPEGERGALDEV